jgi:hypothetical protein
VAALSLGVDLGFGQPMEHVLRQTLIALRLAERAGLEERARVGVFYTAPLVNGISLGAVRGLANPRSLPKARRGSSVISCS